jgi:hypothetical protein
MKRIAVDGWVERWIYGRKAGWERKIAISWDGCVVVKMAVWQKGWLCGRKEVMCK